MERWAPEIFGSVRESASEEAVLTPSHWLGHRYAARAMEMPKRPRDFILLSEFSEQVGPVPVVSVCVEQSVQCPELHALYALLYNIAVLTDVM